jgi:preprotein translocase subunit SecA
VGTSFEDFSEADRQNVEKITAKVKSEIMAALEFQKTHLGPFYPQVQKMLLLQAIDQRWKEHLQRMDQMREWISLRGYAQKDPLVEYKQEAFKLFEEMNGFIRVDVLEKLFKIQLVLQHPDGGDEGVPPEEVARRAPQRSPAPPTSEDRERAEEQLEALKPKKTRMTFGPPPTDDDPGSGGGGLSRSERRRMERDKRRR